MFVGLLLLLCLGEPRLEGCDDGVLASLCLGRGGVRGESGLFLGGCGARLGFGGASGQTFDVSVELGDAGAGLGQLARLGEGLVDQGGRPVDVHLYLVDHGTVLLQEFVQALDLVLHAGDQAERGLVAVQEGVEVVDEEAVAGHVPDGEFEDAHDGVETGLKVQAV